MYTIENDVLKVVVNPLGAELHSLFNKTTGLEYLWNGDATFWGKRSPVLFPIVGTLKNNEYSLNEKKYGLSRHGFAREKTFHVLRQTEHAVAFQLLNDEDTMKVFPFPFAFSILYSIKGNELSVTYHIRNNGDEMMYCSVGGHPAFKLPLKDGLSYEDYYLLFNKNETAGKWPISPDGLIEKESQPFLDNTNRLNLEKSLFYKDAIVLKHLQSDTIDLRSDKHPAGLSFAFEGFPYFGIWAAKDADFVCLEPWCGIADSVDSKQLLTEKEGIIHLPAHETFERSWHVTTF